MVTLLGVAIAGSLAQGTASLETHTSVLQGNAVIVSDYGYNAHNGTYNKLLNAKVNSTNTISNSYIVSGNISYFNPDYLITNMTVGQLNAHAVNKITVATDMSGNVTMIMGSGTSYNNFVPIASSDLNVKYHSFNFSITPAELTGLQSSYIIYEVTFGNNTKIASYTVTTTVNGISSTISNYVTSQDVAYAVSGVLLFVFGFFAIPFHESSIILPTQSENLIAPKKFRKRRGGGKR